MTPFRIPFMRLVPGEDRSDVDAAIRRVIERGWFVLGPEVEAFEEAFAALSGARAAVGVANGTDAIALILRAIGIGQGDEVITTPLSAAYTALAVMQVGAKPVFADIDPDRLTIDAAAAEALVTSRTAAILPVHLYGRPAGLERLEAVARRHGLALVEDCCQAHLATFKGKPVGTVGVAGAFSFYPTKNLGALGDGGAVITDDAVLAGRVRRLRNGGQSGRYNHVEFGINSRLDEIQAAILRARLRRLEEWTRRRRELAGLYRSQLRDGPVAVLEPEEGHVYHLFVVRSAERVALQAHLVSAGIETLIHYPVPITRQPAFESMEPAECPVADRACREVLSLPLYPGMPEEHVVGVSRAVQSFAGSQIP
jgi:dTDP-4-amino-4,6-dideoxygalactose transaminase